MLLAIITKKVSISLVHQVSEARPTEVIPQALVDETLAYYEKHKNKDHIVKPSIPILYFGDAEAYLRSELRVVTVGKNPSNNEFKLLKNDEYSFCRFPSWDPERYNLQEPLNEYFEKLPLSWFSSFEPILNGMNVSYHKNKGASHRALHTDICSPLATDPTWSLLKKEEQIALFQEGYPLWKELIEVLKPDIMLVSVPWALFRELVPSEGIQLKSFALTMKEELRKKEYLVLEHQYPLKSGKISRVIYGKPAQKPFDTISKEQKILIGKEIIGCQR